MDTITSGTVAHRRCHIMGMHGHITIGWTQAEDRQVKELIQSKIDQGFAFFAIVPAHMGKAAEEVKVTMASDIGDLKNVVIKDPEVERFFREGSVGIISEPTPENIITSGRVTADEAVKTDTVAVAQKRGG